MEHSKKMAKSSPMFYRHWLIKSNEHAAQALCVPNTSTIDQETEEFLVYICEPGTTCSSNSLMFLGEIRGKNINLFALKGKQRNLVDSGIISISSNGNGRIQFNSNKIWEPSNAPPSPVKPTPTPTPAPTPQPVPAPQPPAQAPLDIMASPSPRRVQNVKFVHQYPCQHLATTLRRRKTGCMLLLHLVFYLYSY